VKGEAAKGKRGGERGTTFIITMREMEKLSTMLTSLHTDQKAGDGSGKES